MGNAQANIQNNNTITLAVRTSNAFRLENMPTQPPQLWRHRIDQQLWDELYQHVMSCEAYGMNQELRKKHRCNVFYIILASLLILVGFTLAFIGGLTLLIMDAMEDSNWWETTTDTDTDKEGETQGIIYLVVGIVLCIFGTILGWYGQKRDREIRKQWTNHVRTQLSMKLNILNQKYHRKLYFTLDPYNVRITVEIKVPNVEYIADGPQYQAPLGGTGGNENQQLIVNEVAVVDADGFVDVQMQDGRIVKCRVMGGGVNNYGSANEANEPLIDAKCGGEGNNDGYTMK